MIRLFGDGVLLAVVAERHPLDGLAVGAQAQAIDAGIAVLVEQVGDLVGHLRALDHQAGLGVRPRRARIEVHRADEEPLPVDHRDLGVQPAKAQAERTEEADVARQRGAHLVELDAELQHLEPVLRVAPVDELLVGGADAVGQHGDAELARDRVLQELHSLLAGDEVGRGDQDAGTRGRELLQDAAVHRRERVARVAQRALVRRVREDLRRGVVQGHAAGRQLVVDRGAAERVARLGQELGRRGSHQLVEALRAGGRRRPPASWPRRPPAPGRPRCCSSSDRTPATARGRSVPPR